MQQVLFHYVLLAIIKNMEKCQKLFVICRRKNTLKIHRIIWMFIQNVDLKYSYKKRILGGLIFMLIAKGCNVISYMKSRQLIIFLNI